ncbi:NUDIX domain-containing protein [Elsinoe ampelina]|uniref:NUDIX domain-containing protein n=1 Tax=Elsinoe ampelina TaxID=302913 RepID=A0A6A6GHB2_9PEZI|nr:NUDIX domain-containing protein [Elsinoe ampelina]
MAASLSNAKVLKQEPLKDDEAKWVRLVKTTYNSADNKTRDWESAERRTRPEGSLIDGVGIVAILEKANGPEILLQKQYRPPIDKVVIEVPAGLVDAGETAETCAVRELLEETGYHGKPMEGGLSKTPIMFNDPGFCNTNLNMVHVTVDMSDPRNQNPQPQTEENEFIECFTIPLARLYEECGKLESQGYAIDARVGTLAEGIEVAKKWKIQ